MTRCAILRTRLPFLCNMATTTCKPAAEPVLPLVRTVPENVQSRDTFYHEPEFLTWRREGSCLNGTRRSFYLPRPDYEGHISLPRVECHEQISFPQGDPRRQRQFRRQQGSRIASPITMRGTMI